jgi:hypothetical protein
MSRSTIRSQVSGVRWRWLHQADRVLCSRPAGAAAAVLTLLIILGCTTHNHYQNADPIVAEAKVTTPAPEASATEALAQKGKIFFKAGTEQVIYYPIPYASTPNLELDDPGYFELLEQHETSFRIRCRTGTDYQTFTTHWHARGVRAPAVMPAAAAVLPPPVQAPARLLTPNDVPPPPTPVELPAQ